MLKLYQSIDSNWLTLQTHLQKYLFLIQLLASSKVAEVKNSRDFTRFEAWGNTTQLLTDRVTQQILVYQQNMTVWMTPEEKKRYAWRLLHKHI